MDELDLHGVRHEKVELLVEDFVLRHELPLRIITGNSPTMKHIVAEVLRRHGYRGDVESDYNLGSIIVREDHW
jgi:hypothetical protein